MHRLSAEYNNNVKVALIITYRKLKTFRGLSPFHSQIILEDYGVLLPVEMYMYDYNLFIQTP
jgi:hypothetical protein